jgi:serine protease AprX
VDPETQEIRTMSGRTDSMRRGGKPTTVVSLRTIAAGTACLALLISFPRSTSAIPRDGGKVSAEVIEKARGARPDDMVPVIVQTLADPTDGHLMRMQGRGGALKARHVAITGYSASVPAAALDDLADDPEVERISLDAPVRAFMDIALQAIRADVAIAAQPGLDGSGVGIAMVDTGVQLHPDLVRPHGSPQPIEVEIVGHEKGLQDYYGHGTHVAGILNGSGALSSGPDAFRTFRGVAPGAALISLRALQPDGSGATSDILLAIDWVITHRQGKRIGVLNLSLGHPVYESYVTDPLCRAARAAVDAGIVVVVAAGNGGGTGSGYGTITSPGNEPSVITVGAMDDSHTAAREDDVLAPYSAKGPTLVDFIVKPDLVAPGTFVTSLRAQGSWIDTAHHEVVLHVGDYRSSADRDRDGDYLVLSGTSLAAPMVAGAAALMLQQDPDLGPSDVKARLMASATKDSLLPFESGAGYLDVAAALASTARAASALSPRAVAQPDGGIVMTPLEGTWSGSWQQSLIWGGGRLYGTIDETENDVVTASGLVWGGGSHLATDPTVDSLSMIWGGGH